MVWTSTRKRVGVRDRHGGRIVLLKELLMAQILEIVVVEQFMIRSTYLVNQSIGGPSFLRFNRLVVFDVF